MAASISRRIFISSRTRTLLQLPCKCNVFMHSVQIHRLSDQPFFKSTITIPESDQKPLKPPENKHKSSRRLRKYLIGGFGIGLLYYFAIRKLHKTLDNMDLNDIAFIYAEGVHQGLLWYNKHLALGMLRADAHVLDEFECQQANDLLIIKSENDPTLDDMIDSNKGSMKMHFGITNKQKTRFGTVKMEITPPKDGDDGNIGFMLKDFEGTDNNLHILLTVTKENDDEIIVFNKVLTDNDYDSDIMQLWFEEADHEIETELAL